jgi:dihydrofolate reductase
VGAPRRFVYYVAASADGFIARPDGAVDWLESRPAADYGFEGFLSSIDTVVWGRTTFDGYGVKPPGLDPFGPRRHVVLSSRPPPPGLDPRATFTSEPAAAVAARLRAQGGKDVWLMGGAALARSFLDAGAVDEVVVHVIPVLLGAGIPLFAPGAEAPLRLRDTHAYADGVVRLRYDVVRAP